MESESDTKNVVVGDAGSPMEETLPPIERSEEERLQIENARLLTLAQRLQQENGDLINLAKMMEKKMKYMTTRHERLENNFIDKFELLKIGVEDILLDHAGMDNKMFSDKIKAFFVHQHPSSAFMSHQGTSFPTAEDKGLQNAAISLLFTLDETNEVLTSASHPFDIGASNLSEGEKFITSFNNNKCQEYATSLLLRLEPKLAGPLPPVPPGDVEGDSDNNDDAGDEIINDEWQPLQNPDVEMYDVNTVSLSPSFYNKKARDQYVLIRERHSSTDKKWMFSVAKLCHQREILKADGFVGRIFKVDYYKRNSSEDYSFQRNEQELGLVVDDDQIAIELPTPSKITRVGVLYFDHDFSIYDIPFVPC